MIFSGINRAVHRVWPIAFRATELADAATAEENGYGDEYTADDEETCA
ncbi:hypothetical protein [Streptomyces inhibens]|nr:hypothetical protein [Streptomyces inhibens]UKY47980.1 hypothetical protein KI385_03555 [Streptomyces inhibens]